MLVQEFHVESVKFVITSYHQRDLAVADIKDAYLHVPIFPEHQWFLHFALGLLHYQFVTLPCSLMLALWVFIKVLAPVLNLLHFPRPLWDRCLWLSRHSSNSDGSCTFKNRCWNFTHSSFEVSGSSSVYTSGQSVPKEKPSGLGLKLSSPGVVQLKAFMRS